MNAESIELQIEPIELRAKQVEEFQFPKKSYRKFCEEKREISEKDKFKNNLYAPLMELDAVQERLKTVPVKLQSTPEENKLHSNYYSSLIELEDTQL
ncbi:hypothetical protein KBC04_02070 [Candidatus Babeliales bacterium]|nr:hypothetical protein [Candidatus Babeliales bacterium]MBP9843804.1 hypothetical protein [Candidatus Babeliales bacterium]